MVPSLYGERLMRYTREVSDALDDGRPVVALESTIIAHGLPRPENLEVAVAIEEVVREEGAAPATIAVVEGMVRIGLDREALEAIAGDDVVKCSARDLAVVMARGATGATTVAATATLAARAGIRVFATGGLGGVHREARESWDESADLTTLGETPITRRVRGREVDPRRRGDARAARDAERDAARLPDRPASPASTSPTPASRCRGASTRRRRSPSAHARARAGARRDRGRQPDRRAARRRAARPVLRSALAAARPGGIRGKDITPFLLERFHRETGGASLRRTCGSCCATPRWRRRSRARSGMTLRRPRRRDGRRGRPRAGPLARGSDTPARMSVEGGGFGGQRRGVGGRARHAGVAGVPVGDDARGGRRSSSPARRRRGARGRRRRAADRHLRRARRAGRRAHDAARTRAPTTRRLPEIPLGSSPARGRLLAAARRRAGGALAAIERARAAGMTVSRRPVLVGADPPRRDPGRRPAAAERARGRGAGRRPGEWSSSSARAARAGGRRRGAGRAPVEVV